jgi:mono/diheme cytochrome c family protein
MRNLLLVTIAVALLPTLAMAEPAKQYQEEILPLLAKYCHKCHNHAKKEGELDLGRYDSFAKALEVRPMWDNLVKRVEAKEMPPEGAPMPSDEERQKLVAWIKALPKPADDCNQLATDETQHFYRGYVMSRRLTRAEYNNTIRDLVGVDLRPADQFPSDGSGGEGFDTVGDTLFTSPIHLEKYLAAAHQVIDTVLPDDGASLSPELKAAREKLLIAEPTNGVAPRDAAQQTLRVFAKRAFRRPVTDEELAKYLALFDKAQSRGDSYIASLRLAFKGILVSPHLLFIVEPEPEQEGVYRLGHYQLAQRLSYFLWSSMPDDELLTLAEQGQLHDNDILRQQVHRMLKDPKARALGEVFAMQWLDLDKLGGGARPDANRFPEFNDELVTALKNETAWFVGSIFQGDRSLLELIDADYTFANERLAAHYGLADVKGPEMRRVSLTDKNRGGVVTQAGVMITTSYPLRTSPVLRGQWVLEHLLGAKVPPPPPNVPALPEDDKPTDGLTLRQRLEAHRSKPECSSCHARMDPLGFSLENFDVLGRWRTEAGGQPVDSSGQLPSGEKVSSPADLKKVLLAKKGEVVRHLTRKMLGYALGRELNKFDQCVITDTMKALNQNNYRSSVLVENIVLSYPFQHRYVKK